MGQQSLSKKQSPSNAQPLTDSEEFLEIVELSVDVSTDCDGSPDVRYV